MSLFIVNYLRVIFPGLDNRDASHHCVNSAEEEACTISIDHLSMHQISYAFKLHSYAGEGLPVHRMIEAGTARDFGTRSSRDLGACGFRMMFGSGGPRPPL